MLLSPFIDVLTEIKCFSSHRAVHQSTWNPNLRTFALKPMLFHLNSQPPDMITFEELEGIKY